MIRCRHINQIKKHKNCSPTLISATDEMIGVNQQLFFHTFLHGIKIHLSALLLEVFFNVSLPPGVHVRSVFSSRPSPFLQTICTDLIYTLKHDTQMKIFRDPIALVKDLRIIYADIM